MVIVGHVVIDMNFLCSLSILATVKKLEVDLTISVAVWIHQLEVDLTISVAVWIHPGPGGGPPSFARVSCYTPCPVLSKKDFQ